MGRTTFLLRLSINESQTQYNFTLKYWSKIFVLFFLSELHFVEKIEKLH